MVQLSNPSLEVCGHVGLEVVNGAGGEGMCYDLPFPRVLASVSDVEYARDTGDESFIEGTTYLSANGVHRGLGLRILLQEAIAVCINDTQALWRGYRHMIEAHADDLPIPLVSRVHCNTQG